MLQRGSGNAVLQGRLKVLPIQQTADYAAGKGIPAAHAVHNGVNAVFFGMIKFLCIPGINTCGPAVIRCGMAHAQGGHTVLKMVVGYHLLKNGLISCQLQIPAGDIRFAGFIPQHQLCIFFVSNAYIHILHQVFHDFLGLLRRPEFLAEIQVHRYLYAVLPGRLQGLLRQYGSRVGYRRGNSCKVKPVCPFEYGVKVKICHSRGRNGRMCPVINHLGRSHGRTALQIIYAETFPASGDMLCAHAILPQGSHRTLPDLVVRHCRHVFHFMPIVCQGYSHVCLSAAIIYVKFICLYKLLKIGGRQPQHDLTHGNYLRHCSLFLSFILVPDKIPACSSGEFLFFAS